MGRLDGKVAIITGAASGIGRAGALRMAAEGARVVAGDFDEAGVRQTVELLTAAGGTGVAVRYDAMDTASIESLIGAARANYGALHVLYNNVGGTDSSRDTGLVSLDWSYWDRAIALNLNATAYTARCAIPLIAESGGGSIVNTSSGSALRGDMLPTAYAAAKGAIISLTRSIATQHGRQGIRCNCISPGMILSYRATPRPQALLDALLRHTLVPYHGQPEDIANTALFLASDESRFITGQTFEVDGGMNCHGVPWADLQDMARSGKPLYPPQAART
ncbi:MAG: SDR family NAD(P)-dependent oxidoreductase [Gammaproteobacteria bacterium]